MKTLLDSTSKFNIYSSFTLSSDDINVVSLLYAPLIGADALMLYMAFQSLLERSNLKSESLSHNDFFDLFSLNVKRFIDARSKLEGIGLLITYYNEEDSTYIYVINPPYTAKNFIKDATLGLYLYSKVNQETWEFITKHFIIEKIDKTSYENITKSFDEVYTSNVDNEVTFDKYKYLLGRKSNSSVKIKNPEFDIEFFKKSINQDYLEAGITKTFESQIINLAFVYGFDESDMISLYNDSINKKGLYDYKLLKRKANMLFNYKRNMKAPKLEAKDENNVSNDELENFLNNASASDLLSSVNKNFDVKYLDRVLEIYSGINLERGVVNCMILKVMNEKGGELPTLAYMKKVAETWISDNIFTTKDAIKYVTSPKEKEAKNYSYPGNKNSQVNQENGGFEEL